jgi:hypothetical protein
VEFNVASCSVLAVTLSLLSDFRHPISTGKPVHLCATLAPLDFDD